MKNGRGWHPTGDLSYITNMGIPIKLTRIQWKVGGNEMNKFDPKTFQMGWFNKPPTSHWELTIVTKISKNHTTSFNDVEYGVPHLQCEM